MTAPANVVPLLADGEPPMTEHELRIYWRAYGDGWRDCANSAGDREVYNAGFLAGLQTGIDAEQAPKRPNLRIVS